MLPLLKYGFESLFATLFPAECRLCGQLLDNVSRLPVCTSCLDQLKTFENPQCFVCGELIFAAQGNDSLLLCGLCQRAKPSYQRAYAHGPYEGTLRGLIHLLKYHHVTPAAKPLGRLLVGALAPVWSEAGEDAIVVPVPLHGSRYSERGFNHAEEIARLALKASGRKGMLDARLLARTRATTSQTGLTRHQRRQNVRGAFAVPRKLKRVVAGKKIILVDDVFTTGTTAEECSRVLLRAGAAKVWVATVARVSKLEAVSSEQHELFGNEILREERATAATGNANVAGN